MHMRLIDGKVLNVLTGTKSTQCCPICGVTPTKVLEITDFSSETFTPKLGALKFGVSPLHAWIRFLEFVLNISYRIEIQKWHIKGDNKIKMSTRKKYIQEKILKDMGLRISMPKQNGNGNSNDGNTARRAFANTKLLSTITNFSEALLNNFYIILIAISCNYYINSEKFRSFWESTFCLYMQTYPWYPMSPTIHKVLVHGFQINNSTLVPLGCLGENASEERNKMYKKDRLSHARKNSRVNTMTDIFYRAIDSSDPLLSSVCLKERERKNKKKPLSKEVLSLLELSSTESKDSCEYENDSQSDSDSDYNIYYIELEEEDEVI
ncbi:uncharacterized protein LOC117186127 [Drosophila miranda]|uniref:uncharacterized protein LOC117186127 n=1 Tax=Drosophila miranda TaxID=7229 RepID=UPI00143F5604|nr:uncharacterized protein LOC117186127 [Drosophila miranda]XP_033242172.1 uncharacterized protein LOC117186127 [Drosophila miranda]